MIGTLIVFAIAFTWLLYESDWMRIRLPVGKISGIFLLAAPSEVKLLAPVLPVLIEYSFEKSIKEKFCVACGNPLRWNLPSDYNRWCRSKICPECLTKEEEQAKTYKPEPVILETSARAILKGLRDIHKMRLPTWDIPPDGIRIGNISLPIRLFRDSITALKDYKLSFRLDDHKITIGYEGNKVKGQVILKSECWSNGNRRNRHNIMLDDNDPNNPGVDGISNRVAIQIGKEG